MKSRSPYASHTTTVLSLAGTSIAALAIGGATLALAAGSSFRRASSAQAYTAELCTIVPSPLGFTLAVIDVATLLDATVPAGAACTPVPPTNTPSAIFYACEVTAPGKVRLRAGALGNLSLVAPAGTYCVSLVKR